MKAWTARRKGIRWTVDWAGDGQPEPGHVVRHVTPARRASYARVLTVRDVVPRKALREGYSARYVITVERLPERPESGCHWTLWAWARRRPRPSLPSSPEGDRWSPLL